MRRRCATPYPVGRLFRVTFEPGDRFPPLAPRPSVSRPGLASTCSSRTCLSLIHLNVELVGVHFRFRLLAFALTSLRRAASTSDFGTATIARRARSNDG